jgi:hypothetical protein
MKKIIGLYLIVGVFSIFIWPKIFPPNPNRTFDEHSYTWLATQIRETGIGYLKSFANTFLTDEQLKAQVPPNRALLPIYLALVNPKATEVADFQSSMIVIQIAWLCLIGWICYREFGLNKGLIPFAFFCCSPFWIGTSGRIWVDWFFNLFITAAFWNGLQWWRSASKKNLIFLNVNLLLAALTKETVILYLAGLFVFLVYAAFRKNPSASDNSKRIQGLWLSLFIAGASITLWLSILTGNPMALLIRMSRVAENNVWAHIFAMGPWFRYLVDEIMMNPIAFILALSTFLKRDVDDQFRVWRSWFWIILLSFSFLPFKELRYLGLLEAPIAFALFYQIQSWSKKKTTIIALSLIVIICSLAQARFIFSKDGSKDGILIGTSFELFRTQGFWNPSGKQN